MTYTIDLQKIADELEFDFEDVEMLIEVFLDSVDINMQELKNAISNNDLETIFNISHAIKGSSSNLLLTDISLIAQKLENNSRSGTSMNYDEAYSKLKLLIENIKV